jgi:3-phosphoglycerate kinase
VLPPDLVVAAGPAEPQTALVVASGAIPAGQMLLDIGPRAAQLYAARIAAARTVFWNGPMGVAEVPRFAAGSRAVASAMVRNRAFTVIGGGDTGAAVRAFGYPASLFSHVSTGGGASLEFLAGRELPGLIALDQGTTAAPALAG